MKANDQDAAEMPLAPSTTPPNLAVRVLGFDDPSFGEEMGAEFQGLFVDNGRTFDLSRLDGVTIALDYRRALLDLDRGYATDFKLKPTESFGQGVAMTPSVLRDGVLKSHILFDAQILFGMLHAKQTAEAIHLIAHECAHVEINKQFDDAFPDVLLKSRVPEIRSYHRWEIVLACWDEYAACMRSANFGVGRADRYREAFLLALEHTRDRANESIKRYRVHGDLAVIIAEVCDGYRALMKYSAYHLGNLKGLGISWRDDAETSAAIGDHWFLAYFERLEHACADIDRERGRWTDRAPFDRLADVGEDVIADGGLHFVEMPDGRIRIEIPFSSETMPD